MKIGIEGSIFRSQPSGVGKYLISLIQILVTQRPDAELFIYTNERIYLPKDLSCNIKIVEDKTFFRYLKPNIWLKFISGYYIKKDELDYYISAIGFLPKLPFKVKSISVIHDLNFILASDTLKGFHYLAHLLFLRKDILKTSCIITNSVGTASKIKKVYNRAVNVIINPPTPEYFQKISNENINKIITKYNITYPYFLTVGNLEPRKNLIFTINVFIDLLNQNKLNGHKLIIVGALGWKSKKLIDICNKYSDFIIRLGYVQESDLPSLYNGATVFLFPSLYEGFGMPVREALKCNTQVITSDIIELHESGFDQCFFINPYDHVQYKNCILSILNGEKKNIVINNQLINEQYHKFVDFVHEM